MDFYNSAFSTAGDDIGHSPQEKVGSRVIKLDEWLLQTRQPQQEISDNGEHSKYPRHEGHGTSKPNGYRHGDNEENGYEHFHRNNKHYSSKNKVDNRPVPTEQFNNIHGHTMMDSMETVTLSWENINVQVKPQNRMCCRGPDPNFVPKHVLRNVYGMVRPGTLLAIIGASGSGKTTLLNTLTSRVNSETLSASGDIRINGIDVGTGIRNISAYVQQDDLFISTMTVKEHLTFRALLRMEAELGRRKRLQRVDEVIQELGLKKCENNMIGDPGRLKGISGGEMRRLSFASEVLTNPPLLFCDEPTSGLDSFMAENIVQLLKSMADKGKTVLCTIHQPSSEVFALFHDVLVMAEGRVAYMGHSAGALKFFKRAGYRCPKNYNPADFYILTMAVVPGRERDCKQQIEAVCNIYDRSEQSHAMLNAIKYDSENPRRNAVIFEEAFSGTSRYEASWCQQFVSVFVRSWLTILREPMILRVRIGQTIVLGLLLGLIYLQLDIDQPGVMNINGVLFLILMNLSFTNIFGVLSSFPDETPIFLREYGIGLYRIDVYFLCKNIAELPSFTVIPFIFCCITYWMIGLYSSAEAFFIYSAICILVANISVSFGYIVSTAAKSVSAALAIAPPLLIPLIMFGGFFLNSKSVPVYFIWLEYLSWFKYSNELIAVNQWENVNSIACDNSTICLYKSGDQVLTYLKFTKDNKWLDWGVLFAMLIVYRIIAFIILFVKAKMSKK